jgi:hypothetical protein
MKAKFKFMKAVSKKRFSFVYDFKLFGWATKILKIKKNIILKHSFLNKNHFLKKPVLQSKH